MNDFSQLGLPQTLLNALARLNFTTPTPIQAAAIPFAMKGRDILGTAQTGTGKTGAFALPLINHIMNNPQSTAIVMTPTRELATQVMKAITQFIEGSSNIRAALLIGGEPMGRQLKQLGQNPRIIVGTPGRINDHLSRNSVRLSNADFLVLDETDRMLDMGFGVQIDKILARMPKDRQTLLFSATLPSHITKLSSRYLRDPERVSIGSTSAVATNIKQEVIDTTTENKYAALTLELEQRGGSIIVFVKTKHGADRLARKLARENHSADAIHGDLRQNQRDRVIKAFRDERSRILVATDVAARGLDIPHVRHVINYDLPQCPEDYIHRIGRTARAGAEGAAVCLLTREDGAKWRAITRLMDPNAKQDDGEQRDYNRGGRKGGFNNRHRKPHRKGGAPNFRNGPKPERNDNARPDSRPDARPNARPDSKNEFRKKFKHEPRGENRGAFKSEPRGEARPNDRFEKRKEFKGYGGGGYKGHNGKPKNNFRSDDRSAPRADNRSDSRPDSRSDNRNDRPRNNFKKDGGSGGNWRPKRAA